MRTRVLLFSGLAILIVSLIVIGQTTQPTTAPAKISESARTILNSLRDAYANAKTLDLAGTITLHLDAAGEKANDTTQFTASYDSSGRFRHETKDEILMISDGQHAYMYLPQKKQYVTLDAPKPRLELHDLPAALEAKLEQQNPSLLLVLLKDAAVGLTGGSDSVDRLPDEIVEGTAYEAMQFSSAGQEIHVLVNPRTSLLRRISVDLKKHLVSQGISQVNEATVTVDYATATADAPVLAAFSWIPPADAIEVKLPAPDAPDPGNDPAMALMGKPAPIFALNDLQDKQVSLADLKGHVVILDFWATWCGPCVQWMPHVEAVSRDFAARGLQVYAVNVRETKDQVQKFLAEKKLVLPVLLDADGKVSDQYQANAIPQTVVIGKDGTVQKVFVGIGPDTEDQLRAVVEAAMK